MGLQWIRQRPTFRRLLRLSLTELPIPVDNIVGMSMSSSGPGSVPLYVGTSYDSGSWVQEERETLPK